MNNSLECPICSLDTSSLGELTKIKCGRCGVYEITGTVGAMLASVIGSDRLARARLVHAIRRRASEESVLVLSSYNISDLSREPLPDIGRQVVNLLLWIASALDDDWFGRIPCSWPDDLVGVVGAVDGQGVERLIKHAVTERLVEHDADNDEMGLTPGGWDRIAPLLNSSKLGGADNQSGLGQLQNSMEWDAFISHASEDKEEFVRPLADSLQAQGIRVWYDSFTLTIGDSLRRSIDHGLIYSRFGIVILSPNFLRKEWPQKELDGLIARESDAQKVILPIWHNISRDEVMRYSPIMADKKAGSSDGGVDCLVAELLKVIKS